MSYKIAIAGATGNVGKQILQILDERDFPVSEVVALSSKRTEGKELSFGDTKILKAQPLEEYDFTGTDIALFSPGSAVSKTYAPIAGDSGCVVIDNTSYFRMSEDVPLVIPEVNPQDIAKFGARNIIANPNCSTIQMLVALKPLHDFAKIKRIVVSTYQSVSGAGRSAMDELYRHTKSIYENKNNDPVNFTKPIPFNIIPQIDDFADGGYTKEELKMINETHKILSPEIEVTATCVRVPVFVGHSESINIEFENSINVKDAHSILRNAKGVTVVDDVSKKVYTTPKDCVGFDDVFVSRIRQDSTVENGLNLWVTSDNLRKGAALNAVQIAEKLIEEYLF